MNFTLLDWSAIVAYLGITLFLGLYFRSRSGKNISEYFVSGRSVSWWLAGTSMVATTFAADTPLVVTGLVYTQGISGNWLWWAFLLSGMMTVFLFARLWRRSGLLTDVQFAEMRYSGKPAAFLRGFRAIYLGLLMNCLILGWVTKAMTSIVAITLGVSDRNALAICVLFLIPFTGLYVALGGLWGVLWTDLFQFALKMTIVIGVAWYAVAAAGGMSALLNRLAELRAAAGPGAGDATSFFPDLLRPLQQEGLWVLPVLAFLVNIGVQWWAFWYPGAEPGGGGYLAQRIFSAKDERNGLHYVIVSRLVTVLLVIASALVAALLQSVGEGWKIVLETGAGTGAVYLLLWYWWRINAWSEISAMAAALIMSVGLRFTKFYTTGSVVDSAARALVVTAVTTVVWLIVTFVTPPEPEGVLLKFYRSVRPQLTG